MRKAPLGALVWFTLGDANRGRNDGHVGISLGDGRMIHALTTVQIDAIETSRWWRTRYLGWTPAPEEWPGLPPLPTLPQPTTATPEATSRPENIPPLRTRKTLRIDNRVTNGMSMSQDPVPLRLTTKPWRYCTTRGCNIAGTERTTGDTYDAATCQTAGERFTNGNDHDAVDDNNPNLAISTRYYGVELAGTTTFGYVSEVWVQAADRGGLGLPAC